MFPWFGENAAACDAATPRGSRVRCGEPDICRIERGCDYGQRAGVTPVFDLHESASGGLVWRDCGMLISQWSGWRVWGQACPAPPTLHVAVRRGFRDGLYAPTRCGGGRKRDGTAIHSWRCPRNYDGPAGMLMFRQAHHERLGMVRRGFGGRMRGPAGVRWPDARSGGGLDASPGGPDAGRAIRWRRWRGGFGRVGLAR